MATNFHTPYVDGTTAMNVAGLDTPFGELDKVAGKTIHVFAVARGIITQNGTTVKWPDIEIFHHKDTTGDLIRNKLPSDSTGLSIANGYGLVISLSETDNATLSSAVSGDVIDLDAAPTSLDGATGAGKVILFSRAPMASGTGLLHYVILKPPQPLRGTSEITASAGSTVVNFPTGYTAPSNEYMVIMTPTSTEGTNNFYDKNPRVTTKATTSFTVSHANNVDSPDFDWMVIGN